jgi:hypothetical protein
MAQGDNDKKYGILPDALDEELNAFAKRYDELMAKPGTTRAEAIYEARKEQTLELSEMKGQAQLAGCIFRFK